MSNKIQAAEDLKRLARTFKGLLEFADELEKVGQLENANKEIMASHVKLRADTEKLNGLAEAAADKCKQQRELADKIISDAHYQADKAAAESKAHAEIVGKELADKFAARSMKAKAEAEKFESAAEASRLELAELQEQLDEKKGELESLKSELAALKQKFG